MYVVHVLCVLYVLHIRTVQGYIHMCTVLFLFLLPSNVRRFVYVWDTVSRRILYKLPGHKGTVNGVHFHPKEPIREYTYIRTYVRTYIIRASILCVSTPYTP